MASEATHPLPFYPGARSLRRYVPQAVEGHVRGNVLSSAFKWLERPVLRGVRSLALQAVIAGPNKTAPRSEPGRGFVNVSAACR
jgi:hypothetical protein